MTIKNWPQQERPREKLLNQGAEKLSNAELLAILFGSGFAGKSALDLAHDSLQHFGSLRNVFTVKLADFIRPIGLSKRKYCQLHAARELSSRCLLETLQHQDVLADSLTSRRYLQQRLMHRQQEVFACLFLDTQNRVISYDEMFFGSIDQAHVHPREVVKRALAVNAKRLILAHNHPSGSAKPSQADQKITKILQNALEIVSIDVIDHIVVGDDETTSMADLQLM